MSQLLLVLLTEGSSSYHGDTGAAVEVGRYSDKTVQVTGTFGTGGDVDMQGSNLAAPDTADWGQLNDVTGTPISMGNVNPVTVLDNTLFMRPDVSAGDGTTDLTVTVICVVRGK